MAMIVKNNMSAVNTLNTLNKNQSALGKSLQKVSSGMKINSAQDDASGYAISERMRVMLRSLDQANQNTQNGSSLMKNAEGAVANTVEILKTLKEKAINAATDTNTDEDRAIIQKEINQLVDQIDDNALITFNGKYLLDGSKSAAGAATYNAWTNEALAEDTQASTKLTELKARNGEALTIEETDKLTVSYVQNGKTYTTTKTISEMDSQTIGGIFKLAEDIDKTSTTFATAKNEAVSKAGGMLTTSTNKDILNSAIAYLKDALSINANKAPGSNVAATSISQSTAGLANSANMGRNLIFAVDSGTAQTAGISQFNTRYLGTATDSTVSGIGGLKLDAVSSGSSSLNSYFDKDLTAIGKQFLMNSNYDGELFTAVKQALLDYNAVVTKIGDYTTGTAASIINQLKAIDQNIVWDGDLGTIYNYKDKIYASGDSTLISYYETYTEAISQKQTAKEVLDKALFNYNEGLAQLAALSALSEFEDMKSNYLTAVDTFVQALGSEMKTATEGTYKVAAGSSNNTKDLIYNAEADATAEQKSKSIQAILDAVEFKLKDLLSQDELDLASLQGKLWKDVTYFVGGGFGIDGTNIQSGQTTGAASTINTNYSGLTFTPKDATASVQYSKVLTYNLKALESGAGSAGTSLGGYDASAIEYSSGTTTGGTGSVFSNLIEKAMCVDPAFIDYDGDGVADVDMTSTTTNFRKYLDLAQNKYLADFSGPSLLTGSSVGVDPAGKTVSTLDGKAALTFMANTAGTAGQISGFTVSVSDSEGNVRKSVNSVLNAWSTTVYAKDASEKDNSLTFQIGSAANQSISVDMADLRARALGLKGLDGTVVNVSSKENANAAISVFENALQKALDVQTTIGAIEARLEYTSSNLTTSSENVQSAESTIRDADMAKEMTNYTKNNVLLQAAQSMLAQANQNSSAVLSLLQ